MMNLGMRIRRQSRRSVEDEPTGTTLSDRLNRYVEYVGYQRVEQATRRSSAWGTVFQNGAR